MPTKKPNDIKGKAPKQERSRETFEVILKATTRILSKEGAEGLNTNLIAKVAGVSVGSLYQYFRNKESIMQTLLVRVLDSGLAGADKVLAEESDPHKAIERLVRSTLDTLTQQGPATLYILEAAPRLIKSQRFEQVDSIMIPKFLEKAQRHGIQIRSKRPELAILLSIQAVRAAGWALVRDKGRKLNKDEVAEELTELLCRYLLWEKNAS